MFNCLNRPFRLSIAGRKEEAASGMGELVSDGEFSKFFGSELGAIVAPEDLWDAMSGKCHLGSVDYALSCC